MGLRTASSHEETVVSLQERIQSDLTAAMKARDKRRTAALRMVVSEMKNAAVEKGVGPQGELEDAEVERILQREVKRRTEAAEAYREAGRDEQAEADETDAAIYAEYLPEALSDEELGSLVDGAIEEVGAEGPQHMGQVMKMVMSRVGSRAEGSRVSELVKSRLMS
jgi:uncharacterized protein